MTVINTNYCSIDEAWGDLTAKSKKDSNKKKKIVPPNDPICDLYEAKSNSTSYNETDLVRFANEYYDKYDKSKYQRNMKTQSMASEEIEREESPKSLVINKDQSRYQVTSENKRNPSNALFEKQFEMNLPPLYDGSDCPLIGNSKKMNDYHNNEINEEQYMKPKYSPQEHVSTIYSEHSPPAIYSEHYDSDEEDHIVESEYKMRSQQEQRRFKNKNNVSYSEEEKTKNNRYFDDYDDSNSYHVMKKKYNHIQIFDLILYVISGIILIFLLEQFVRIGINMQGSL